MGTIILHRCQGHKDHDSLAKQKAHGDGKYDSRIALRKQGLEEAIPSWPSSARVPGVRFVGKGVYSVDIRYPLEQKQDCREPRPEPCAVDGKASPEVIARRSNLRKSFIANSSGALFVLEACGKMLRIETGHLVDGLSAAKGHGHVWSVIDVDASLRIAIE